LGDHPERRIYSNKKDKNTERVLSQHYLQFEVENGKPNYHPTDNSTYSRKNHRTHEADTFRTENRLFHERSLVLANPPWEYEHLPCQDPNGKELSSKQISHTKDTP